MFLFWEKEWKISLSEISYQNLFGLQKMFCCLWWSLPHQWHITEIVLHGQYSLKKNCHHHFLRRTNTFGRFCFCLQGRQPLFPRFFLTHSTWKSGLPLEEKICWLGGKRSSLKTKELICYKEQNRVSSLTNVLFPLKGICHHKWVLELENWTLCSWINRIIIP